MLITESEIERFAISFMSDHSFWSKLNVLTDSFRNIPFRFLSVPACMVSLNYLSKYVRRKKDTDFKMSFTTMRAFNTQATFIRIPMFLKRRLFYV